MQELRTLLRPGRRCSTAGTRRNDSFHWESMQPNGAIIDWPLLCVWVAISRFSGSVAVLGKMGADRIDHRGLLADEEMARPMDRNLSPAHSRGSPTQVDTTGGRPAGVLITILKYNLTLSPTQAFIGFLNSTSDDKEFVAFNSALCAPVATILLKSGESTTLLTNPTTTTIPMRKQRC